MSTIGSVSHASLHWVTAPCTQLYEKLKILFTDLLPANLTCILPNALSWAYRTQWTGSIQSETLTSATKTASLFTHHLPRERESSAILLLHGEQSHPATMLHLADIAQAEGRAVFSLYLPYDDDHPEIHRSLLHQSIDRIDQLIANQGGRLRHLLLAGHSRGAIEGTQEAIVAENPKVDGVIAIAGRFKVIKPSTRPCRESLEPSINLIWQKLGAFHQPLRVPFRQIAARYDWCIDPEASLVRTDQSHLTVDAGHLGVICDPGTLRQFKSWVAV